MVEYKLPKLDTGVRFPSLAPVLFGRKEGIEAKFRRPNREEEASGRKKFGRPVVRPMVLIQKLRTIPSKAVVFIVGRAKGWPNGGDSPRSLQYCSGEKRESKPNFAYAYQE